MRIPTVEYLRGLASLAVAWFHMTNGFNGSWVAWLGSGGWLGVEAFFVISGFVIPFALWTSYSAYRFADLPHFLGRRVLRIEPPYIISILIVLVLGFVSSLVPGFQGQQPDFHLGQIAAHLFYLVPFTDYEWLQPVYWTLAYEFAFYITMAIFFPNLSGANRIVHFLSAVGFIVILVGFGYASELVLLFVMGFVVFRGLAKQDNKVTSLMVLASCALVMILRDATAQALVGFGTALVILFHTKIVRLFRYAEPILLWFGRISYSLYLIHVPIGGRVVNLGKRFVADDFGYMVVALAGLGASIAAAFVFYKLVEVPAIKLAQKLLPSRHSEAQKS